MAGSLTLRVITPDRIAKLDRTAMVAYYRDRFANAADFTLFVVGAFKLEEAVSRRLGRTVNPTIYTPQDLAKRVKGKEAFAARVPAQPKLWLIGGEDALGL